MNEDSFDAYRYFLRGSWLLDQEARMAGERLFGQSSHEREWRAGGWPGTRAMVERNGPWRRAMTMHPTGVAYAFDGWWRESTPDERRRAMRLDHV